MDPMAREKRKCPGIRQDRKGHRSAASYAEVALPPRLPALKLHPEP